uniref:Sushi domain containing 3 n=1 Tax=Nothobranchius furzeri TaxID=105023 RepID=A0A8C6Q3P6_NOTFU
MSGATAATADGSRTELKKTDKSRAGKKDHWQLQCSPIPLPALGTQRIIQGNGTNVGSIVSLQCPARHKLVGKDLMCVMGSNSTQWVGQTYCQPLSFYEDYGFRVAVLSSIISSGIILLLSVAFITCCLLNCIKEDSKKRFDRALSLLFFRNCPFFPELRCSEWLHVGVAVLTICKFCLFLDIFSSSFSRKTVFFGHFTFLFLVLLSLEDFYCYFLAFFSLFEHLL